MSFQLVVNYRPRGDQANAIEELTRGIRDGEKHQVLLGVPEIRIEQVTVVFVEDRARAGL